LEGEGDKWKLGGKREDKLNRPNEQKRKWEKANEGHLIATELYVYK
jgi:hypothetical protein